ncbi:1295_t:CDS:2, partial [Gigaspora rosea]
LPIEDTDPLQNNFSNNYIEADIGLPLSEKITLLLGVNKLEGIEEQGPETELKTQQKALDARVLAILEPVVVLALNTEVLAILELVVVFFSFGYRVLATLELVVVLAFDTEILAILGPIVVLEFYKQFYEY